MEEESKKYHTSLLFDSIKRRADRDVIERYLQAGADVNAKNNHKETPLLLACHQYEDEDVVELLLDSGAEDCYAPCREFPPWLPPIKRTPLVYAASKGWLKTIKYLVIKKGSDVDNGHINPPILVAASFNKPDVVRLLISLGANVNIKSKGDGETVLHIAALNGWLDIVKMVLERSVLHVNAKDFEGNTPLYESIEHVDIFKVLLEAGADCNFQDRKGRTLIEVLIEKSRTELIKLCIENGAYFEVDDYENMLKKPLLIQGILQDVEICSNAILNKFNCKDLSALYKIPFCANVLPEIGKMKITDSSEIIPDIMQNVSLVKEAQGHYNFHEKRPIILKALCVKSILCYYHEVLKKN